MISPEDDSDDPARAAAMIASVAPMVGVACAACARSLCGHDAVLSIVLGYKHRPRCSHCLAIELGEPQPELCERCLQWISRRECFVAAWHWASAHEGQPQGMRPPCLWHGAAGTAAPAPDALKADVVTAAPDAHWDAGEMGCGDLVLELRLRLRAMAPATVLELRAADPGAPADIPAWCGLTGHALLRAEHPRYWIRRKND